MTVNPGDLISLGKAVLKVKGLNPQRIGTMSEARVPGLPTFTGMDYQATGLGEKHTRLECLTYPHVVGGMDAVGWLQDSFSREESVNFIRLQANFNGQNLGLVRIRHLFLDETHLHPMDHVGRKITVEVDLLFVGDLPSSLSQLSAAGLTTA